MKKKNWMTIAEWLELTKQQRLTLIDTYRLMFAGNLVHIMGRLKRRQS